ncbi:MAG: aminopeptidase P family N-terminal domain-containing protein, partial [Bacteroidota bacterium]
MSPLEILHSLRTRMQALGIDAYIWPRTDPHSSEYLVPYWQVMPWMTGFTGSAGTVVITRDFAGVWTDSRYFIQGEKQLAGSGFELMKLNVPHTAEFMDWLAENLVAGSKVGVPGMLFSASRIESLGKKLSPAGIEWED